MHRTEKDALRRIDYDSCVSTPDNQVTGLRMNYSLKFAGSDIEVRGRHVAVGKPSPTIDRVNEVRTIRLGAQVDTGVQRRCNHSQAIIRCERPRGNGCLACADVAFSCGVTFARTFRSTNLL